MEEFKQTQKFLIMAPRKIRAVVAVVKKLNPEDAIVKLEFIKRSSAVVLSKVIKAAIAQARIKGIDPKELKFKEIQITEGPRLKRGRPASRGRWHPYKKRMSHIRVVLTSVKPEVKEIKKQEKKVEVKKEIKLEKVKKTVKKGVKNGTKS